MIRIATIVEGHGDVFAVPVLLQRLAREREPPLRIVVPRPIRQPRQRLLRDQELEHAARLAESDAGPQGGILVLLDADDDCPATLGPQLLFRVRNVCPQTPAGVVLAKREYEAWFLAAAVSLRNRFGFPETLAPPGDPEAVNGAKEWLRKHMPAERRYRETADQEALTRTFDLETARTAPSFDKCCREVQRLFGEIAARSAKSSESL